MEEYVFYCADCKQTYSGTNYQKEDTPRCTNCRKPTKPIGMTREQWTQKPREERRAILQAMNDQQVQAQQKAEKRMEYADSIGVTYQESSKSSIEKTVDELYKDIGKKIKSWARVVFYLEAIATVIGALVMAVMAEYAWMILLALLSVPLGITVAWVSSWLLYGFGELIDKTVANEENTRNILKLMLENQAEKEKE